MTFEDLLENRRSIRRYKEQTVSLDIIKDIIKDSILAPSSGNGQPWKYIIINNQDLMKRMSDESKGNILARIAANPDDYAKKYEGMLRNKEFNVFFNAPSLVIIFGEADLKNLYVDCALAASYFMMSATSRGLGTCWVNLGAVIKDPGLLEEIGLPDNAQIIAPITLGYPETIPVAPKRNEPEILRVIN